MFCKKINNKVFLILEYAENGNLYKFIKSHTNPTKTNKIQENGKTNAQKNLKKETKTEKIQKTTLSPYQISKLFKKICLGVQAIHNSGFVHRDLKPENILLTKNDQPKICDFGWSTTIESKLNKTRNTFCGTYEYMAPEIYEKREYGVSVDIWSLGVLLFEIFFGKSPFLGESVFRIYRNIIEGEVDFGADIDRDAKMLILRILKTDVRERPSLQEIFNSRFIRKFDFVFENFGNLDVFDNCFENNQDFKENKDFEGMENKNFKENKSFEEIDYENFGTKKKNCEGNDDLENLEKLKEKEYNSDYGNFNEAENCGGIFMKFKSNNEKILKNDIKKCNKSYNKKKIYLIKKKFSVEKKNLNVDKKKFKNENKYFKLEKKKLNLLKKKSNNEDKYYIVDKKSLNLEKKKFENDKYFILDKKILEKKKLQNEENCINIDKKQIENKNFNFDIVKKNLKRKYYSENKKLNKDKSKKKINLKKNEKFFKIDIEENDTYKTKNKNVKLKNEKYFSIDSIKKIKFSIKKKEKVFSSLDDSGLLNAINLLKNNEYQKKKLKLKKKKIVSDKKYRKNKFNLYSMFKKKINKLPPPKKLRIKKKKSDSCFHSKKMKNEKQISLIKKKNIFSRTNLQINKKDSIYQLKPISKTIKNDSLYSKKTLSKRSNKNSLSFSKKMLLNLEKKEKNLSLKKKLLKNLILCEKSKKTEKNMNLLMSNLKMSNSKFMSPTILKKKKKKKKLLEKIFYLFYF